MNKYFKILNIITIISILIGDIFFITIGGLLIKSITSLLFVSLGIINLIYAIKSKIFNKNFCLLMIIGLIFAMLGDILLEIEFIVGAALFAIGHIFYFCAYSSLFKFNINVLIFSLLIFIPAVLIITLVPIFDFNGIIMQLVCIIYALIISLMVGKAISNFAKEKTKLNALILIGSCLFFFSDFMLLFSVFSNISKIFLILCLASYYPAEILLALSISQTETKKTHIS